MSGHSKWATIKRKKAATDAKRGAVFTRLSKEITVAARMGGGDITMNPALRLAVKNAKGANMPAANIEKAIKKGTGDLPGQRYEDFVYEGYGPGGVAIMMEVMTDNKNRTIPEIRHIMTKNNGNLGEAGCVNWMFEKKGTINIAKANAGEEELLELALDLGAEDFSSDDAEMYEITTAPEEFGAVSTGLEEAGYDIESGQLNLDPTNTVKVDGNVAAQVIRLLEALEDNEDIQKVYSNVDFDEADLADV